MIKISDAELEIMKIIWENNEITAVEIINNLNSSNWSDNTIKTLINRLKKKGAITSMSKDNKTVYKYLISEEKYRNFATKDFIEKVYSNSIENFIRDCVSKKMIKTKDIRKLL